MIDKLYLTLIILSVFILAYGIENAMLDVTSSGSTANTLSNSAGNNTAITGGYESATTYQSGSSSNTTNNSTTNNSSNQETAVAPANAPAMSIYGQDSCTIPLSLGMTVIGFSTSMGTYYTDLRCEKRKKIKLLNALSMKVAAIALACSDKYVWIAMKNAGTICPVDGLIGKDAEKRWEELGNEKYFDNANATFSSKRRHFSKSNY